MAYFLQQSRKWRYLVGKVGAGGCPLPCKSSRTIPACWSTAQDNLTQEVTTEENSKSFIKENHQYIRCHRVGTGIPCAWLWHAWCPFSLAPKDSHNLGHLSLFPEWSLELHCLIFLMVAQRTAPPGCWSCKYISGGGTLLQFPKTVAKYKEGKGKSRWMAWLLLQRRCCFPLLSSGSHMTLQST